VQGVLPPGLYAIFNTSMGIIKVRLFEEEAPLTVQHFVGLAKGTLAWKLPKREEIPPAKEEPKPVAGRGAASKAAPPPLPPAPTAPTEPGDVVKRPAYNNTLFYRIIPDQMVQGGDPSGKGDYNCGVTIKDEIVPSLKFDTPGRLAMATSGKDTGGCQFFFTQASPAPQWDGIFTIFGQVVQGQEVVKAMASLPVTPDGSFRPGMPPKLIAVMIQRIGPEPPKKK
jgi:cyclophilin family peptidyl-prolyl cis-trans isomerase